MNSPSDIILSSSSLEAQFDRQTGELRRLQNRLTAEAIALNPLNAFRIEFESECLRSEDCPAPQVEHDSSRVRSLFRGERYEVEIVQSLAPDRHFLQRQLVLRPLHGRPYLIRRIDLQVTEINAPGWQLVPFQHGQCRTYFLRGQNTSFMFGVQVPVLDAEQTELNRITLGYPVNVRFPAGETYRAETLFWATCKLAGRLAPPAPRSVKECFQSPFQPDMGESEAMLAMVKTQLSVLPRRVVAALNGCQNHTSVDPYEEPYRAGVEADKKLFGRARDMLGDCIIQPFPTWVGADVAISKMTSKEEKLPSLPVREEFLAWAAEQGFKVSMYCPFKGIWPWDFDGRKLYRYCPDRDDWLGIHPEYPLPFTLLRQEALWQATGRILRRSRGASSVAGAAMEDRMAGQDGVFGFGGFRKDSTCVANATPAKQVAPRLAAGSFTFNCPVNRPFMEWFTRVLLDDLRRHPVLGEYMLDEAVPKPRYQLICNSTEHDHLPGDTSYGYFLARRTLFQALRAEFGERVLLNGERPQQDCGIWDALYLDSLFTLSEMLDSVNCDTVRTWSRIRYYYHFVPPSIDEVPVKHFEKENLDILMLSVLAVSRNYVFCEMPMGWSRVRLRAVRRWVDWARKHADLMDDCVFLPDWPGQGCCDGYVRTKDNQGYAFFFNANKDEAAAELPLDETAGLTPGRTYRVAPEFVVAAAGSFSLAPLQPAAGRVRFRLPARAAVLLRIEME